MKELSNSQNHILNDDMVLKCQSSRRLLYVSTLGGCIPLLVNLINNEQGIKGGKG